ncbi:MAG: efflux RND transporter permease subunit, partial [Candidatus Eremiobacterota bacterium]
ERRKVGFTRHYYRFARLCVTHRWWVMLFGALFLGIGVWCFAQLKTQFFPKDLQYLSYVELNLPMDKTLVSTNLEAVKAEQIIRDAAAEVGKQHPDRDGKPRKVLKNLTTFLGGGGPRFWFSVEPELRQLYYAQIIVEVYDKHDTEALLAAIEEPLGRLMAGVRVDVRQLETGKPVGVPVALRLTGDSVTEMRRISEQVKQVLRRSPYSTKVRDDWGEDGMVLEVETDPDRANMAGVTNLDVARSTSGALSGQSVTVLREGDRQIPVIVKLRMLERAQLSDLRNLYVYSGEGEQKVRLGQVARVELKMQPQQIRRRQFHRTMTIGAFPITGHLPSEVIQSVAPELEKLAATLPPGYRLTVAGEQEEQEKSFLELAMVMAISMAAIYVALVFQFKNAIKPMLVFGGIPFGFTGALAALWIMDAPFGFMAFLGIAALVGVIVSHIIVLFDYIEEMHAEGESFMESLLDAGIARLRPVLITVGATVFAMIPLVHSGGPLWAPLCYTQIGGLTVATCVTLLLVPVMYAIFVLDLKILKWEGPLREAAEEEPPPSPPEAPAPAEAASPEPPATAITESPEAEAAPAGSPAATQKIPRSELPPEPDGGTSPE